MSVVEHLEDVGGTVERGESKIPFLRGRVTKVTLPGMAISSFDLQDLRTFNDLDCVRLENFSMTKPGVRVNVTTQEFDTPSTLKLLFDGPYDGFNIGPPSD